MEEAVEIEVKEETNPEEAPKRAADFGCIEEDKKEEE